MIEYKIGDLVKMSWEYPPDRPMGIVVKSDPRPIFKDWVWVYWMQEEILSLNDTSTLRKISKKV